MQGIISDNEIDEDAAKEFLLDNYRKIDLLPGVPEKLMDSDAAFLLKVSLPTITRLCESGEITLTKTSLLDYIFRQFTYLAPLDLQQKTLKNEVKSAQKTTQITPDSPK